MGLYRRRDRHRKSRVWWISYVIAGRQHRESSGSSNKRIAEKILAARRAQVFEERWNLPRSKAPRLQDYAQQFLDAIAHGNTRSRYQSSVNNLLAYFGPNIRLSEIMAEAVFAFQQARLADGAGKATVNRDVATLSSMLSKGKKLRYVSHNSCADVTKLNERRDRRQARPLSYDEENRLKQFAAPWLRILVTLLVETGLRVRKEALPLLWSDVLIDSEPACIYIRQSKSAAGVRTVWLTNHCRYALIRWRDEWGPRFSPYVFPSPRIPNSHLTDYKTAWEKTAKSAGLEGRRVYDLRATFASRANACHATSLTVAAWAFEYPDPADLRQTNRREYAIHYHCSRQCAKIDCRWKHPVNRLFHSHTSDHQRTPV